MILDTSAISAWGKEDPAILRVFSPSVGLEIPVIVVGEYRFGVRRSRERARLESWLDGLTRHLPVLPIGLETADAYATIRQQLHESGRPIPPNDLWIAALALEHGVPIVSRDKHFDAVDGVTRIDW